MPSANVTIATAVNMGASANRRKTYRSDFISRLYETGQN
jgi:hypothetical protein